MSFGWDLLDEVLREHPSAAQLAESHRRLELIYRLADAVCSETDVAGVAEAVVPALGRVIRMERCLVAVLDEAGRLRARASMNLDLDDDVRRWPVSKTIIDEVMSRGAAILTLDAADDSAFSSSKSVVANQIRSVLAVPLGQKGSCDGVIYADNRVDSGAFTKADLAFVTVLAQFIRIAFRNASALARVQSERDLDSQRWELLQQEAMLEQEIVGASEPIRAAFDRLQRVAAKRIPVLLLGETGTGKDVFARALHRLSPRAAGPFVGVNVAALPETLAESELFGHERGAFSGALARKRGRFELASTGTLFLDELGELSPAIQAKLLRVLETGEFERVGGTETLRTNVRLVSATNRDLQHEVRNGRFREDLLYRIQGVTVVVPPLRERPDDVPALVDHLLRRIHSSKRIDREAMRALARYPWPGNVRQLMRIVEELDAVVDGAVIRLADLPSYVQTRRSPDSEGFPTLEQVVTEVERVHFRKALAAAGGNNERAMELLDISRTKYFDRKKTFGM
ncbi:MAG: sigma 54-interacting transcriptional regulator [Deltaproteobacteria bacterium]|nr:sigma 54-interacting transcriptional regulator [Deltaproteobacteria bacterium]